jgi:hypothetical protein
MKPKHNLLCAALAAAAWTTSGLAGDTAHETPVPVAMTDYVTEDTIEGSGLVLAPLAEPDGATLQFSGTGPRGRFAISGRENLRAYAAMLRAIDALEKMDRDKMFGKAAGQAAKAPVEAAAKLVSDPGKTLAAVPKGAMNFLKRTGRQIQESTRQIAEGSANSTGAADLVGLGSIKRQLAVSLGVDPYLPDETFQNVLNETASAAYLGGVGVKALTMLVAPVAVSQVVTGLNISGDLAKKIVASSAADLRASDREDLASLGVPPDTTAALFANRSFTPASTAVLVDSLMKIGTKKGLPQFVAACAAAEDTADATYYREVAALLAQRVAAQGPLARLEMFHSLPVAVSQQNELVVPLPADLLWWTPTVDDISQALLQSKGAPFAGAELWTDGRLTPAADAALRERGYTISQRK